MGIQIIAEVGECFNGNIKTALEMIEVAKNVGCNTVKFQLLDINELAEDDPEYNWFEKLILPPEKISLFIEKSKEVDIEILFTPVSVKTARYLYESGLKNVKIASSFMNKVQLLEYINEHFETVYISTGMADLEEIIAVVDLLDKPEEIILLHCISEYPTGPLLKKRGLKSLAEKDAHLNMMMILKALYPRLKVGYSDHTDGILVPMVAASMGADVIEKHFTMNREIPIEHYNQNKEYMGTDHVLSIEPPMLKKMVEQIRQIEKIKGSWEWKRSEGEIILKDFLRGRHVER